MTDFDLIVGRSVEHVLGVLRDHQEAMVVAGATDFLPLVRAGRWHTSMALDITGLDDLRTIKPLGQGLEIGALTTHAELIRSRLVADRAPVLAEAARTVAGPQIQARATLGGNICTASPAADTVPALLVLDAEVVLTSAETERRMPLSELLLGPGQTALRPGELLTSVHIPPIPRGSGMAFDKLGRRKTLIISVANTAALLVANGAHISEARVAVGAVAPTVVRCPTAEASLVGQEPNEAVFGKGASRIQEAIRPIDDVRATAAYRRVAAEGLVRRTLSRAWEGCAR
jgi:xanthine dehydrogenase FAD-binding subunit